MPPRARRNQPETLTAALARLLERVLVPDLRERAKEPPSTRSSKPSTTRNACSNAPPCSGWTCLPAGFGSIKRSQLLRARWLDMTIAPSLQLAPWCAWRFNK